MSLRLRHLSIACLLVTFFTTPGLGQGLQTGVVGNVRDASGGVIPGVAITVTNRATAVARTAVTDTEGNFLVTSLVAGGYDVRAELSGFKDRGSSKRSGPDRQHRSRRLRPRRRRGWRDCRSTGGCRYSHPQDRRRVAWCRVDGEPGAGTPREEPQLHGTRPARAGSDRGARGEPEHSRPHAAAQHIRSRPAALRQQHPPRRCRHHRWICKREHVHSFTRVSQGSQRADRPVRRGLRVLFGGAGRHDRQVRPEHPARERLHLSPE